MTENTGSKAPIWFTVVAAILLVWNLLGVMAYITHVTVSADGLAALPEVQRQMYLDTPVWVTAAFAVAVNAGALGCALLLLRKNLAVPVLCVSLAGVLVQNFHAFFISDVLEVLGPGGLVMPILVIIVAVCLVWLAVKARARNWTN